MGAATLTVLESFGPPKPTTNPYLTQLAASLRARLVVRHFSWKAALTADYDVFHVHWPEVLMRSGGRWRTWRRRALYAALLTRLTVKRIPVVRTVHNETPHEAPSPTERVLLAWTDRLTKAWIELNPGTRARRGLIRAVPHGHYRDWYADFEHPAPVAGRLVFFGLVRRYKGVPELLRAFATVTDPEVTLRVLGSCNDADLASEITGAATGDPRITVELSYLGDADLSREVGEAQLVVLPYREMHNSGAMLLALSLDRPVLVPASPLVETLAAEVGPGWIFTYSGDLTDDDLTRALAETAAGITGRPTLEARDWETVGRQHAEVFGEVTAVAGRR